MNLPGSPHHYIHHLKIPSKSTNYVKITRGNLKDHVVYANKMPCLLLIIQQKTQCIKMPWLQTDLETPFVFRLDFALDPWPQFGSDPHLLSHLLSQTKGPNLKETRHWNSSSAHTCVEYATCVTTPILTYSESVLRNNKDNEKYDPRAILLPIHYSQLDSRCIYYANTNTTGAK